MGKSYPNFTPDKRSNYEKQPRNYTYIQRERETEDTFVYTPSNRKHSPAPINFAAGISILFGDLIEQMEGQSEETGQCEDKKTDLISGLPDDIALFCLARVPRKYHTVLKCVCRKWRDLVCSEDWYVYRKMHNLSETWIYALCRDKSEQMCCYVLDPDASRRSWKLIQGLPPCCLKRKGIGFEALGKHLYLLGGCSWSVDATNEVYSYDISRNSWSEAASMSTARCFFACHVLDGKIYTIGGLGSKATDPHSWDTYDPHKNTWELHSDSNAIYDVEDSIAYDGKIYIRCATSAVSSHVYAVLYNPSNGTWQHADSDMASGWRGPAVVVDGTLYVLDQSSGTKLMMWRRDERDWVAVGRLSPMLTRPPCQLVAIEKRIFIIGKGLSTVVFDVEKSTNVEGVMISSSIPGLNSEDDVLGYRSLAL